MPGDELPRGPSVRAGTEVGRGRFEHDDADAFRRAFEDAPIGMAIVGLDGRLLRSNAALEALTGRSNEDLRELEPHELSHPDDAGLSAHEMRRSLTGSGDSYRIEKRWSNASGHTIWVVVSSALVRDAQQRPLYFVWHVEDRSIREREETRLRHLADHDALTGLTNRRRFHEALGQQVARCQRYGEEAAVLVLDLDGFKAVNDELGHAAGDEMLRRTGRILGERARDTDVVARLGGDEFAVLLLHVNAEYAALVADELGEALGALRPAPGHEPLGASIGRVMVTASSGGADDLLAAADAAMYAAKRSRADEPPPPERRFAR